MSQEVENENIRHMSWGAQEFLRRPSSRVLSLAIFGLALSCVLTMALSFFIEVDVAATAAGEVTSSFGLREIRATNAGVLTSLSKKAGDPVVENEVIGSLSIGQMTEEELKKIQFQIQAVSKNIAKADPSQFKIEIPTVDTAKLGQAELSEAFLEIQKTANALRNSQSSRQKILSSEVQPLRKREVALVEKIKALKKSKHRSLLGLQIESTQDELDRLRIQISGQLNQSLVKIQEAHRDLLKALNQLSSQMDLVVQAHQIRSPIRGTIGKLDVQKSSQISTNQLITTIVPLNTAMQVQLKVFSKDIGKIKVGQRVNLKLEAYPYQHYGVFTGEVIQVDRIRKTIGEDADDYLVKASILLPKESRTPASEIVLIDGMRLEGSIVIRRSTIFRLVSDRITGALP